MKLAGAIFDLDGTLLDSMFIWDTIGEDYLRSRGIEPREKLNEKFKTMSLYQAACYYQTQYGLTDSTEAIMNGVNAMVQHFYTDVVLPKPGVPEFLTRLEEQNVKLCIATATDRHLVEAALARNGLTSRFGAIFTCGEVGHGKDEPDIYHAAHHFLGTPKCSTWVFEDAPHAAATAKSAGYPVVGVFDPWAGQTEAFREMTDLYIRSFVEVEAVLHENGTDHSRL